MLCITPRYTYAEIMKSQRTSCPQAIKTLDSTFGFKKPSDIWHLEHFM